MKNRPAVFVILTFVGLIVAGTVALYGIGFGPDHRHDLLEASFTAVSAVCVTGLSVVDLETETGFAGQLTVLLLMQVGGLGVLTLSNWVLLVLRRRLSLSGAVVTSSTYGGLLHVSPRVVLGRVVLFTLLVEGAGALLLFPRFASSASVPDAAWRAVFHAVSAFCNAGFSLFSDSLSAYRHDAYVNGVVMALIVAGGLGFVVAVDLASWVRDRMRGGRRKLTYHTRVVLVASLVLTFVGFLGCLVFEWRNTLTTDSVSEGALESLFLSVTARTAGFNTVETGHLTNMALLHLMLLMMIGASPGSTGGGIKTTTFAIVWARVRSHLLNRRDTELLGRRVPDELVAKAMAMVLVYALIAMAALLALQATEYGEMPHDQTRGTFLEHLFEVVSALSTVGLSTGTTASLSDAGLGVLMACMFIGRVGPLVLAASLVGERPRMPYTKPSGDVMVG